jgi:hypothetical protein
VLRGESDRPRTRVGERLALTIERRGRTIESMLRSEPRAPGIGLSLAALVVAGVLGSFANLVLASLFAVGFALDATTGGQLGVSRLIALVLIMAVLRVCIGAWIVQWVVQLAGAYVSFLRALGAILAGSVVSIPVTILVALSHPTTLGAVVAPLTGVIVSVWILQSRPARPRASAAESNYRRPPGAPPNWPFGE